MNKFTELNPPERSRTYHIFEGEKLTFNDVLRISISDSGTHRLETGDGLKHIVPDLWIAITIDTDAWTF